MLLLIHQGSPADHYALAESLMTERAEFTRWRQRVVYLVRSHHKNGELHFTYCYCSEYKLYNTLLIFVSM